MSYTAGDIPLWGVTSLMTEDQKDRGKVLALARIVATAGVLGMAVQFLAPSLKGFFAARGVSDDATQLQYSFIMLAIIVTIFSSILFQFAGLSVKEKVKQQTDEQLTQSRKTSRQCGDVFPSVSSLFPAFSEARFSFFQQSPFRSLSISSLITIPAELLQVKAG